MESYFINSGDQRNPIVPAHIWEGKDPGLFSNYDPARGWPIVSGPYGLAHSVPAQKVWDLRHDWWAARLGFQDLPEAERLIYLPSLTQRRRSLSNS